MPNQPLEKLLQNIRRVIDRDQVKTLTDEELVERFSSGKEQVAFEALVQRHGPLVLGVCRRILGNAEDVEDAFQAIFVVLAHKSASLHKRRSVGSWLYTIAYHVALKAKAANARRQAHERRAGTMSKVECLGEADWQELRMVLDEELHRLPDRYRAPLVLCYFEGMTHEQAARELGWPVGSMAKRLGRGRELLRQRLELRKIALPAGLLATGLAKHAIAAVPASLVQAAVKAGLIVAVGKTTAGGISASVALLANEAMTAMFVTKLKIATVVLLSVTVLGTGVGWAAHRVLARPPQELAYKEENKNPPANRKNEGAPRTEPHTLVDQNGDPLPQGAMARLGTVRFRHEWTIYAVALSPNEKLLAIGGNEAVCLWDADSGRELRRMYCQVGYAPGIQALAFSHDGEILASAHWDGDIHLWDVSSGREIRVIKEFQAQVQSYYRSSAHLAFTPGDKTLVSLGRDQTIRLWDVTTGKQLRQFTNQKDNQVACALSPDGKIIASGGLDKIVHVWDMSTGKELRQMKGHREIILGVAFSPDGSLIATGGGTDAVHLWETATGKEVRRLALRPHPQRGVTYTSTDHIIFLPDGKTLATGGQTGWYQLFDVATGKEISLLSVPWSSSPIAVMSDGRTMLFLGEEVCTVHFAEAKTGKPTREFGGHAGRIESIALAPDGRTLATSSFLEGAIRIWDRETKKEVRRVRDSARRLGFAPDGRTLVAADDSTIRLWDFPSGKVLKEFEQKQHVCIALSFAADGKATTNYDQAGNIRTYDLATGKEIRKINTQHPIWAAASSWDGSLAATADHADTKIHLWELSTGKKLRTVNRYRGGIVSLAFSHDGKTLAADTGELWETATGGLRRSYKPSRRGTTYYTALAFAPNGKSLAGAELPEHGPRRSVWTKIVVWELPSGRVVREFAGHRGWVSGLAFSPDSKLLVSGSHDTTALVWNVADLASQEEREQKPADIKALWTDLGTSEAARAYQIIGSLIGSPEQTVAFLQKHLHPATKTTPQLEKQIRAAIAHLDDSEFKLRKQAENEIERLKDLAESALREALANKPSPEVRRRVEVLLAHIENEHRGIIRTVEVLEYIATPGARELLRSLAQGAPEARLTQEAKASLDRLAKSSASKP